MTDLARLVDLLTNERADEDIVPLARRVLAATDIGVDDDPSVTSFAMAAAATALLESGHEDDADAAFEHLIQRYNDANDPVVQFHTAVAELHRAQVRLARNDKGGAGLFLRATWERTGRLTDSGLGTPLRLIQLEAAAALAGIALNGSNDSEALAWLQAGLAVIPEAEPSDSELALAVIAVSQILAANVGMQTAGWLLASLAYHALAHRDVATAARAWQWIGDLRRQEGEDQLAHDAYYSGAGALDREELSGELAVLQGRLLNAAGLAADRLGEYGLAARHYRRAYAIFEKFLPGNDNERIVARYNLAELARAGGQNRLAAGELEAVVDGILGDAQSQSRDLLPQAMRNLARALMALGRHEEAERWASQALGLPDLDAKERGLLLMELGGARRLQGEAAPIGDIERALEDMRHALGEDSLTYLSALATFGSMLGPEDRVRAKDYFERAIDGIGDRDFRLRGPVLVNLAGTRWLLGDYNGAYEAFREGRLPWESAMAEQWRIRSVIETQPDEPWPFTSPALVLAARHLADRPDVAQFAFRIAVGSKRLQAEALVRQHELVLEGRDDLIDLQILAATLRETAIWANDDAERNDAERDEVEGFLASEVPREVLLRTFEESEAAVIAEALPERSTLVEYVRTDRFESIGVDSTATPASYLAFVLPAGDPSALRMINLGDAEPIDSLAAELARSIRTSGRDIGPVDGAMPSEAWRDVGRALAALVFDPVDELVDEANVVFVAPAASLCTVPFDALIDRHGRPLLLTYTFSVLGTGRDALRLTHRTNWVSAPPMVMYAPTYGPKAGPFRELPGAKEEGRKVARLLHARSASGRNATRDALLAAENPEVLHLATHGFYLREERERTREDLETFVGRHPLVRSGIALARANASIFGSGVDPAIGVVTALDALGLYLYGTDLVVLSACETGLGPLDDGEGLLGLARSFLLAGARAVVWSLWKVDDYRTAALMLRFYRRLLKEMPRADALRRSKCDLYYEEPDRPDLWAAFVVQGDPDSLVRFRILDPVERQVVKETVRPEGTENTVYLNVPGRIYSLSDVQLESGEILKIGSTSGRNLSLMFAVKKGHEGRAALDCGDFAEAEELLHEALVTLGDKGTGRRAAATMRADLVIVALNQAKYRDARRYGYKALREHERLEMPELDLAVVIDNIAIAEANLGRLSRATELATRALDIKTRILREGHEQTLFTTQLLSDLDRASRSDS